MSWRGRTCAAPPSSRASSPVVPEVYMMVQMSSGVTGRAGTGAFLARTRKAGHAYTLRPVASIAWRGTGSRV